MKNNKTFLIILDGWGHGPVRKADAIALANTPFMDNLYMSYPSGELITFGEDVGLPEGQMGNSEVGHLNIGAGRVVYQELARINKDIREGELEKNPVLLETIHYAKKNNKPLHFIGLVSDGGVHSHINHLLALCDIAQKNGFHEINIHAFTDGRDTDPKSGEAFLQTVLNHIDNKEVRLASVCGRYYAMDRDKRWERVKLSYDAMVNGVGEPSNNVLDTLKKRYEAGETDEFLKPIIIPDQNNRPITIKEGDAVLCFNFRTDRPREITRVLTQEDMPDFQMKKLKLFYATMTRYDETFSDMHVLFETDDLKNTIGEVVSNKGLKQVRLAETEKYPHVTFFFSGGREKEFEGEKRIVIPSAKVATYDLQPEMSAYTVAFAVIDEIRLNEPDFICLNFANTDMVGHTGVFSAAKLAAETVDRCVSRVVTEALSKEYEIIIIADHGNSDYMINPDGTPNTAHTMNPVPCIYVSKNAKGKKVKNGRLADIAPTLLNLMGVEVPTEMTGINLIE